MVTPSLSTLATIYAYLRVGAEQTVKKLAYTDRAAAARVARFIDLPEIWSWHPARLAEAFINKGIVKNAPRKTLLRELTKRLTIGDSTTSLQRAEKLIQKNLEIEITAATKNLPGGEFRAVESVVNQRLRENGHPHMDTVMLIEGLRTCINWSAV